jgi:cytosine/uracil/thiamine/allantoin permease
VSIVRNIFGPHIICDGIIVTLYVRANPHLIKGGLVDFPKMCRAELGYLGANFIIYICYRSIACGKNSI